VLSQDGHGIRPIPSSAQLPSGAVIEIVSAIGNQMGLLREHHMIVLRNRCNTSYFLPGDVMVLNSKGQVTIPAQLRAKYGLHAGDEVEVVEVDGALRIIRTQGAESRGQRLVRRLRGTATGTDVAGMTTDQIMALLRGE
jgi:AbrB family looped-hinge helix DNA binding protein